MLILAQILSVFAIIYTGIVLKYCLKGFKGDDLFLVIPIFIVFISITINLLHLFNIW